MKKTIASLYDISRYLEAHIEKSERKFRVIKKDPLDWYSDPNSTAVDSLDAHHMRLEEVDAIAIHIPEHRVDDFLCLLDERKFKELEIRNQVPAVKKAYEHYKMLLLMCGLE